MSQLTLNAELQNLLHLDQLPHIELDTLRPTDIPALAALSLIAYNRRETAENLTEAVEEMDMLFKGACGDPVNNSFVGAWLEDELVGAILVVLNPPWEDPIDPHVPVILELMVCPDLRSKGIATALIGEVSHRVHQQGYDSIQLRLDIRKTPAAARLYDYLGFTEVPDTPSS